MTPRDLQIALARWNGANARARREYEQHPLILSCTPNHQCDWRLAQRVAWAQTKKEKRA